MNGDGREAQGRWRLSANLFNWISFGAFLRCAEGGRDGAVQVVPPYSPELLAHERKGNKTKPASAWMLVGEEVEDVAPKPETKAVVDFLKAQKNLKAVLAGHLHGFWQGTFNGTVPMIVAPANYAGHALEMSVA